MFPAPKPATYSHEGLIGELLYVPKDFHESPYKYIERCSSDSNRHPSQSQSLKSGSVLSGIGGAHK